jgi:hypothetical protein
MTRDYVRGWLIRITIRGFVLGILFGYLARGTEFASRGFLQDFLPPFLFFGIVITAFLLFVCPPTPYRHWKHVLFACLQPVGIGIGATISGSVGFGAGITAGIVLPILVNIFRVGIGIPTDFITEAEDPPDKPQPPANPGSGPPAFS